MILPRLLRRILRITLWSTAALALILGAGFLWLRQTPAWAGITLFSESARVENFRDMGRVFPARAVPAGDSVRPLPEAPRPLPASYAFAGDDHDLAAFLDRTQTTGLLVLHRGAIAYEAYRLGADATSPFTSWSVAKSVLSALIGIAIDEGHIESLQDPISRYVPALDGSGFGPVPIEDALTMSSGVAFDEDYDSRFSDINMLFIRAMAMGTPMEEILAGLEAERPPGSFNAYSSADSMALGLVLEGATGMPAAAYLSSRLWGPMGAEAAASWSTDRAGREFALCCLNATLHDYARFGLLYLEGGAWDGRQIIPEGWVTASVNPEAPRLQPGENPDSDWTFGYGYKWWIPEHPQGDFTAIGVWGQYVYVHPHHEVVIVKTSADPEFDDNDHETIAAFRAIAAAMAE